MLTFTRTLLYGNNGMRHFLIHQFVLKYSVAQPSLSRLTDVPVQFSIHIPGYVELCITSRTFVWMQNHRYHHRDPANDVVKESGGHCSRKHLNTWFRTSVSLISSSARLVQIVT